MRCFLLLFVSALAAAQGTIPIQIIVNWPPAQLVAAKYGPLPKYVNFGEVIGCNRGDVGLTYGEGDVIALLRTQANLQAFSIQDAMLLVGNSQAASKWNIAKAWLTGAANSVVQSKAAGLIGGGNATGVGIVVGAEAVDIFIPNVQGALSLKQVIQYSKDGLQATMSIPAGRCTVPYSVLFATPGAAPIQGQSLTITANVPVDR